jgi:uracil-DNA glycosylase
VPAATASFVERLAQARIGATFNFYRDGAGAELRRARLADYLAARKRAPILLVGEAAGYRGARLSGIPFTSERQLSGSGPAEASATIVRRALAELGLEESVLCWNLVPTHPHRPGRPESNRPPTRREIAAGRTFVAALAAKRRVVAVGRLAQGELGTSYVRHPSHGGAAAFRTGLIEVLRG